MRSRTIQWVNQWVFRELFKIHDGQLPYSHKESTKTVKERLYIKLNAKPYQCRECFKIGPHKCQGKLCTSTANPAMRPSSASPNSATATIAPPKDTRRETVTAHTT